MKGISFCFVESNAPVQQSYSVNVSTQMTIILGVMAFSHVVFQGIYTQKSLWIDYNKHSPHTAMLVLPQTYHQI